MTMDGVILFVDDHVHDCSAQSGEIVRSRENILFEALRKEHPVLGVPSLEFASSALRSIGSFKAVILDWVFDRRDDLAGSDDDDTISLVTKGSVEQRETLEFLKQNEFYSLVYVYSDEDIKTLYGQELTEHFGNRIRYRIKGQLETAAVEILEDIKEWERQNQQLSIPLTWVSTINQSLQQILVELSAADEDWVREIGKTAADDGVRGELSVLDILQCLLAESLVQNADLTNSIKQQLASAQPREGEQVTSDEASIARLFRRLFYTKLTENAPVMTGDICQLDADMYGIVMTPECDIVDPLKDCDSSLEVVAFRRDAFDAHLQKTLTYSRGSRPTKNQRRALDQLFNQEHMTFHFLPSFPFVDGDSTQTAIIDFSNGCIRVPQFKILNRRTHKLNSPFIQQLRQRFIAYFGRVGVPRIPPSLRQHNL